MHARPPRRAEAGLPPDARLRRRGDFAAVYDTGFKIVETRLVAFLAPAAGRSSGCRLGLSVSRKVGNAPRRNRVKRVLREAFRKLPCREALDLVLVARPGSAPLTEAEARDSLARILDRWHRRRPPAP